MDHQLTKGIYLFSSASSSFSFIPSIFKFQSFIFSCSFLALLFTSLSPLPTPAFPSSLVMVSPPSSPALCELTFSVSCVSPWLPPASSGGGGSLGERLEEDSLGGPQESLNAADPLMALTTPQTCPLKREDNGGPEWGVASSRLNGQFAIHQ